MMETKPRLALAIPVTSPDPSPIGLAMLAALSRAEVRLQHFRARACPLGTETIGGVTGLPGRHLDSWLMTPELCRSVFDRGARPADLAMIEGTLDNFEALKAHPPDRCCNRPGPLGPIARTLDAPVVAAVSCDQLEHFHLPRLSRQVEALLLDGVGDLDEFAALRRMAELMTGLPVLGGLEALPEARAAIRQMPRTSTLDPALIDDLAQSFVACAGPAGLQELRELAASRPLPAIEPPADSGIEPAGRFRVAFAQDEAFGEYFPDTLETLEALGAELVEFSPLADEALPRGVDLVILGCGKPDFFAEDLASNVCLVSDLRSAVCKGLPIYAEGGGAAYLGRLMKLGDRLVPGVGVLPFDAVLREEPEPPAPVERVLNHPGWLGPAGTVVRGYRSNRWELRPAPEPGDCPSRSGPITAEADIYARRNAIGGLVHLHLGALPHVLDAFAGLRRPSAVSGRPRSW